VWGVRGCDGRALGGLMRMGSEHRKGVRVLKDNDL
jgi:hypothetical protein